MLNFSNSEHLLLIILIIEIWTIFVLVSNHKPLNLGLAKKIRHYLSTVQYFCQYLGNNFVWFFWLLPFGNCSSYFHWVDSCRTIICVICYDIVMTVTTDTYCTVSWYLEYICWLIFKLAFSFSAVGNILITKELSGSEKVAFIIKSNYPLSCIIGDIKSYLAFIFGFQFFFHHSLMIFFMRNSLHFFYK